MSSPANEDAAQNLVRQIDVRPTDYDHFRGEVEQKEGRLFGGLVLGQSVMAAGRTVEGADIHSLHAYFLRAGKPAEPIDYSVERIRQGRNFFTRRVTALQGGHTIFEASISFTVTEPGISHQTSMPPAVGPEGQPSWWSTLNLPAPTETQRRRRFDNPIEILLGTESKDLRGPEGLPRRSVWARVAGTLPDDPLIHAAAIAYTSDSGMVATVAHAYGIWQPGGASASLDHAIWYHRPPRFDDWLLYVTDSPVAHNARGLMWGHMYQRDGTIVASVAQEGLFREPPKPA